MKRYSVALLVLLCGCGTWGKKERPVPARDSRAVAPPVQRQPAPAPERRAAIKQESPTPAAPAVVVERSSPSPPVASVVARPRAQVAPTNGANKPDGVVAANCVVTRRVEKGGNKFDILAKNACAYTVEVKAACLPSYAEPNHPYPGTFALDSWLFTLGHSQEQRDRQSAMCLQRGAKVIYASCQAGIPYFTAADGTKFGCYR